MYYKVTGLDAMIFIFLMLNFKETFSLSFIYVFIYFSILHLFMLSQLRRTMPKRQEAFKYL